MPGCMGGEGGVQLQGGRGRVVHGTGPGVQRIEGRVCDRIETQYLL